MDEIVDAIGAVFSDVVDLLARVDPFGYLHQLMNSGNPVAGAALVGIPILVVLFAPVVYWTHWESQQDKRRRRRERARMAKYRARAAGEDRQPS